jgi:hypothetical protein
MQGLPIPRGDGHVAPSERWARYCYISLRLSNAPSNTLSIARRQGASSSFAAEVSRCKRHKQRKTSGLINSFFWACIALRKYCHSFIWEKMKSDIESTSALPVELALMEIQILAPE